MRIFGLTQPSVAIKVEAAIDPTIWAGGKTMWIVTDEIRKCCDGMPLKIPVDTSDHQNVGRGMEDNLSHSGDLRIVPF